jgi:hypothetical protein
MRTFFWGIEVLLQIKDHVEQQCNTPFVQFIGLTRECGWRRDSVRVLRPVAVKPSQAFP